MDHDLNFALGLDDIEESVSLNSISSPLHSDESLSNHIEDAETNSPNSDEGEGKSISPRRSSSLADDNEEQAVPNPFESMMVVGFSFSDLDEAYLCYCEYGRFMGFSVRKGDQKYASKTDEIRWKDYLCSWSGFPDLKRSDGRVADYRKAIKRSDCKAKIRVHKVATGSWNIGVCEKNHNHPLVPTDQAHLLRSCRKLSTAKKGILETLHKVGVRVHTACEFMEEAGGGPSNVGFIRKDAYDHFRSLKQPSKLENADSIAILDYFTKKTNSEPFFFSKVQRDDDDCLLHMFFRDSRSASDYKAFGDILCLDTTYRTNKYNLSCAPFVGVNHHGSNVMFGIGFLSKETTQTFEWLLEAFLESMNGKHPKVVFTDQCRALMNAIDTKFTNSKHRLCQWHINKNASNHFGALNGSHLLRATKRINIEV